MSLRSSVDQSFFISMTTFRWSAMFFKLGRCSRIKISPVISYAQAASEAHAAKQEAARVRNGTSAAVRNLNEQVGRYKNIVAFRSIDLVGV